MKVFYRPEQTARNAGVFSPSAAKPAIAVADWLQLGYITEADIVSFEPVSRADLVRAHDPDFVDGVLSLREPNGFNNRDPELAASLPFTSGSLLAAARYALENQVNVCSPTSGFHHAGYGSAEGFCTFNGLMVTALSLQNSGAARSVGIIDCDVHYGNGTDNIISHLGVKGVHHHTMGKHFHSAADAGGLAGNRFLKWLDRAINDCKNTDLVIYQAGADPHINDPLGGVLSDVAMAKRDHAIFKAFRGKALVWNLAGGYQRDADGGIEPVLKLHRNTVVAQLVHQPNETATTL